MVSPEPWCYDPTTYIDLPESFAHRFAFPPRSRGFLPRRTPLPRRAVAGAAIAARDRDRAAVVDSIEADDHADHAEQAAGNRRQKKAAWSVRHGHPTGYQHQAASGLDLASRGTPPAPPLRFDHTNTAPPSGYGTSGRCSAVAPSGPAPDGSALLALCRLRRNSRRTQGQAQADVARAVRRDVRVAERRPAKRRDDAPTAAAEHAGRAPLGA